MDMIHGCEIVSDWQWLRLEHWHSSEEKQDIEIQLQMIPLTQIVAAQHLHSFHCVK